MVDSLTKYDVMCTAIAECHKVDEVKELRDQARALEVYAKQALNHEAETKACQIRIRAERKAGKLLRMTAKSNGQRNDLTSQGDSGRLSEFKQAKQDANISDHQGERWQKLSDIPDKKFEQDLADQSIPSTEGVLRKNGMLKPVPQIVMPHTSAIMFASGIERFLKDCSLDQLDFYISELNDRENNKVLENAKIAIKKCQLIIAKYQEINHETP